jgi:hypothetical protein
VFHCSAHLGATRPNAGVDRPLCDAFLIALISPPGSHGVSDRITLGTQPKSPLCDLCGLGAMLSRWSQINGVDMQNKAFYCAAIKAANHRSRIVSSAAKTILCGLRMGKGEGVRARIAQPFFSP